MSPYEQDREARSQWIQSLQAEIVRLRAEVAALQEPMARIRRIVEGPFWAVMLPDGTLAVRQFFETHTQAAYRASLDRAEQSRVVRVKSITYEVEVWDDQAKGP